MLTYKLLSIDNGFYHYEIYPEDDIYNKKTIIFNPISHEIKENTFDKSNEKYLIHFTQGVKDENGAYRSSGLVAWG